MNSLIEIIEKQMPPEDLTLFRYSGKVVNIRGNIVESWGPRVSMGDICRIHSGQENRDYLFEVVGFNNKHVLLYPLDHVGAITAGDEILRQEFSRTVPVSELLKGRVIDGLGNPIDGKGPLNTAERIPLINAPPDPMKRRRIIEPLLVGIRSIDCLLTCGKGQRVGIFAGSGVGKSVMLGMMARNSHADINVLALIGERGREVRDFIERDLGQEGLKRSVVVVVTSDKPALIKIKGILLATAISEYFRDKGKDVLLMVDSITRVAMAMREVGLAVGELPTSKGYTPSVFSQLPRILERAGCAEKGSITGFYSVLVEGDDLTDPVADTVRSILDGHIVLSRRLAMQNHYPAVDILQSISRVMIDVIHRNEYEIAKKLIELLAIYREAEDLINIGAYKKGSNPRIDLAIEKIDAINAFLRQEIKEKTERSNDMEKLAKIVEWVK